MLSAVLSALEVYFCLSCAQTLSCIFWGKHDFRNSLEHRQLGKGNRGSSDQLDGEGEGLRDVAQKLKNDKDTGYKIETDSPTFR